MIKILEGWAGVEVQSKKINQLRRRRRQFRRLRDRLELLGKRPVIVQFMSDNAPISC
jgi:hypothetical protein